MDKHFFGGGRVAVGALGTTDEAIAERAIQRAATTSTICFEAKFGVDQVHQLSVSGRLDTFTNPRLAVELTGDGSGGGKAR